MNKKFNSYKKLLESFIRIPEHCKKPWHENNIGMHESFCPITLVFTLTLYTKDHKKQVKINKDCFDLLSNYEQDNWCFIQQHIWKKELYALYKNMGD